MTCDICGEEIRPGDKYFEFPGGTIVCSLDFSCLTDYAEQFSHYEDELDDGPDADQMIEEWRDHRHD